MNNKVLKNIVITLAVVIVLGFAGIMMFRVFREAALVMKQEVTELQNGKPRPVIPGSSENAQGSAAQGDMIPADEDREEFLYKLDTMLSYIDYYYYQDDVDMSAMYDAMLHAAVISLGDPYSTYYSKEEFDALLESSSGVYSGIGATISQNMQTMVMTIVKPFVDSPALKAGLLPGDQLVGVDDEVVIGEDLNEVVAKIKGLEGTTVDITVIRDGEQLTFTVTRARINVEFCSYKMLDNKIGYILVSEFEETTAEQFRQAIDSMQKQGMKGLVIDIRDNPGGLYNIVCKMLDRILPKGSLLVYTEDKYGNKEYEYAETKDTLEIPIAVLVNGNSASASEIFSGALQDYDAATIVGTQTFGKGIVQSVMYMTEEYDGIKLTTSHYYKPNGVCIHGEGITPDVIVELDEDLEKQLIEQRDHDNQIDRAVEIILEQLK